MHELRRCQVPGQQRRRVGSDLGKIQGPGGVLQPIESQNLREGPIDLQSARDALVGKTVSIASVPMLKRIDVGPARDEVENRRILRTREDLHAQEAGCLVDEVRPVEERLADHGLQTVFDAEARNHLNHRDTISGARRLGERETRARRPLRRNGPPCLRCAACQAVRPRRSVGRDSSSVDLQFWVINHPEASAKDSLAGVVFRSYGVEDHASHFQRPGP